MNDRRIVQVEAQDGSGKVISIQIAAECTDEDIIKLLLLDNHNLKETQKLHMERIKMLDKQVFELNKALIEKNAGGKC